MSANDKRLQVPIPGSAAQAEALFSSLSPKKDWRVSVEILWRLVEPICRGCGLPFNGGDVCVGHTGTSGAFAKSAVTKEDGSGRRQNLARRPACEVAAASFHSAGFIERRRMFVIQGVVRTRKVVQGFKGQFHD